MPSIYLDTSSSRLIFIIKSIWIFNEALGFPSEARLGLETAMTIEGGRASTPLTIRSNSPTPPSQQPLGEEEQEGNTASTTSQPFPQTQQSREKIRGHNVPPDYGDPSSHSVWHTGYPMTPSSFVQRATQFCEVSCPFGRPMLMQIRWDHQT